MNDQNTPNSTVAKRQNDDEQTGTLASLTKVRRTFSGDIILPENAAYEQARAVFARKGSPAIIFECKNAEDVTSAIRYAREAKLIISVRSGGHSNAGLSTNDGGVVIDVGPMNHVTLIDENTHRVRVGAGAQWGDIARKLNEYGLVLSSGDTVSVGAGGLSLGGGIGWMVRKYGLAIDNLVQVDIVTAEGEQLIASADSHPDLFWALRGGGGNFGVATAFEFIAHPSGDVSFGTIVYPAQNAPALLTAWRDYMRTAPEDLTTTAMLIPSMAKDMPATFIVTVCWAGDQAAAAAALEPLRKLPGTIMNDSVQVKPYYEALEEAHPPQGFHSEVNNAFFHELSDELIAKITTAFTEHKFIFQIRHLGGVMNRVPVDATAFAHRASEVLVVSPVFSPLNFTEDQIQTALAPWHDIAALSKGAYINFFSRATPKEVAAAYPPATYQRLATIKQRYDPTNVFNQNLNIVPNA
jgi:FAD/FMN-containing dehydrogenase